jgi:hypothetical protein
MAIKPSLFSNEQNRKKKYNKEVHTLLFKEQFKYLRTSHSYHLVDPTPWP